ncbi:MAG: SDR family NAD(P)-dependent oxidoreductase [Verrucomicrobiales bacterium]|nr:SDR family NAD(P)-dependent oxidoreductase [Verrucomicrobiales bacterium]
MKTILITGATDGIGLETTKKLVSLGHRVLLHGRSREKLSAVTETLQNSPNAGPVESYVADLSRLVEVESFAAAILEKHDHLDVIINNAGVYSAPFATTPDGLDLRFAVNTIAPYLLTKRLLPLLNREGRVINLSSAAQSPVDLESLRGNRPINDGEAYAQSKLALTMWTGGLAASLGDTGPAIIAVNPGSFLGSKMVKEAYGMAGKDLSIGANILTRAALDDEFATASGKYFDNDAEQFGYPHPDALNAAKMAKIVEEVEAVLSAKLSA